MENHCRPWLDVAACGSVLSLCPGLSLLEGLYMETTALQACDNIPSTFQAPKPYLFYAGQTKPNILERVLLFSQSFMENLATKIFYNFNGASKLERHAALTGKDMSEYDSSGLSLNKSARPCHLLCKWGFGGIHPKRCLASCSSVDTRQPKLEIHLKNQKPNHPPRALLLFLKQISTVLHSAIPFQPEL